MNRKTKPEEKETTSGNTSKTEPAETGRDGNLASSASEKAAEESQNNGTGEPDLADQVIELNDKYLRLYSEFDNYRKRTIKEKIEITKFASSEIIEKLLPVLDDFERAIKAFDASNEADKAFKDGIVLIFGKFLSILNQQGLEQMRTIGETFDTDFHEAITNMPAPSPEQQGKIIDEIQKGYLLHGKVIRYAKVVVGN